MSANPWSNVFGRLANPKGGLNLSVSRFNPRPAGLIRNGSATHVLLEMFQASPNRYFTHSQLTIRTGCTKRAIDWALIFLRSQQLIECASDESRNVRYLRYKFSGETNVKAQVSQAPKAGGVGVSSDASSLLGVEIQGLPEVRGQRNPDLPAVDPQLGTVHSGHGTGANTGALAGAARCDAGLHAGKLHLDDTRPTNAQAPVVPQGDLAGPDDDLCRSDTPSGDANLVNRAAPDQERVQPGDTQGGKALQKVNLACLAGRDIAATGVGTAPGATPFSALGTSESRDAGGAGDAPSAVPAPGLQASIFNEPSSAINN